MIRQCVQFSIIGRVSVVSLLAGLACSPRAVQPKEAESSGPGPHRLSCVGEQTTHSAHRENDPEYPTRLGALLGSAYEVLNRGLPKGRVLRAGTAPDSDSYFGSEPFVQRLVDQPQVVVLGPWGRHDTYEGNWSEHKADFSMDLEALAMAYVDLESEPTVFLVTPLPFDGGALHPISELREPTEAIAAKLSLPIIDLWGEFLGQGQWYKDGTHLTAEGQQMQARIVAEAVSQLQ